MKPKKRDVLVVGAGGFGNILSLLFLCLGETAKVVPAAITSSASPSRSSVVNDSLTSWPLEQYRPKEPREARAKQSTANSGTLSHKEWWTLSELAQFTAVSTLRRDHRMINASESVLTGSTKMSRKSTAGQPNVSLTRLLPTALESSDHDIHPHSLETVDSTNPREVTEDMLLSQDNSLRVVTKAISPTPTSASRRNVETTEYFLGGFSIDLSHSADIRHEPPTTSVADLSVARETGGELSRDLKVFGTAKPRPPRSTVPGRLSHVFVDPAFHDLSLSWLTKEKDDDDKEKKQLVQTHDGVARSKVEGTDAFGQVLGYPGKETQPPPRVTVDGGAPGPRVAGTSRTLATRPVFAWTPTAASATSYTFSITALTGFHSSDTRLDDLHHDGNPRSQGYVLDSTIKDGGTHASIWNPTKLPGQQEGRQAYSDRPSQHRDQPDLITWAPTKAANEISMSKHDVWRTLSPTAPGVVHKVPPTVSGRSSLPLNGQANGEFGSHDSTPYEPKGLIDSAREEKLPQSVLPSGFSLQAAPPNPPTWSLKGRNGYDVPTEPAVVTLDHVDKAPSHPFPKLASRFSSSSASISSKGEAPTWMSRAQWGSAGDGEEDGREVLYIGGIFELSGNGQEESARSELDAALLAIRHVNDKRVVPGYRLHLLYNDSKCDAGAGTDVFYHMIYRLGAGRHINMLMGSACTEVTKTLAEIVPYWNLILYIFTRRAVQLIDEHEKSRPMFLFLSFQSVHSPLEAPERFVDMYPHIQQANRRIYSGMVSVLDEAFANVTSALERRGMLDNSVIIFLSDNGGSPDVGGNNWPLRGGKFSLWEGGTRVPAFVYSKNLLTRVGYTSNEFVHAVDWFPTMLSMAGRKASDHTDGVDQWPVFRDAKPGRRHEFVYNIDELDQNAAIRVGDYKLIQGEPGRFFDWFPLPESQDEVPPTQYPTWKRRPYTPRMFPEYQLYNLKEDPEERHDLADQMPDVVARLKQRLAYYQRHLVSAQDPPVEPKSLPHNYGGVWSPGWCA